MEKLSAPVAPLREAKKKQDHRQVQCARESSLEAISAKIGIGLRTLALYRKGSVAFSRLLQK